MFDADAKAFLEGGSSLIVGTVGPDNEPFATRGWGLRVGDEAVRLLLNADDSTALDHLVDGAAVAVTATNVLTLYSRQLKGHVIGPLEPASDDDVEWVERYCDAFFADIGRTDGVPRALLDRLVPVGFVACPFVVVDVFDQTPGPSAGASVP